MASGINATENLSKKCGKMDLFLNGRLMYLIVIDQLVNNVRYVLVSLAETVILGMLSLWVLLMLHHVVAIMEPRVSYLATSSIIISNIVGIRWR